MDKFTKETFLRQNLPVRILFGEIHWGNFSSGLATFLILDTTKYIIEKEAQVERYIL